MNSIVVSFFEKVSLYGYGIVINRLIKAIIRFTFHFTWEKCYLMSRSLDRIPPLMEKYDIIIKELNLSDYRTKLWSDFFTEEKQKIYEQRFCNNRAKAYGAFINGELVYSTWILYGEIVFREKVSLIKSDDYALLLDSYCHPNFRGRGLHNYMNYWCLYEMTNHGVKKAYVIVLSYNRPAIKTQRKCGLQVEKTFYGFKIGKWRYCTMKPCYQKES